MLINSNYVVKYAYFNMITRAKTKMHMIQKSHFQKMQKTGNVFYWTKDIPKIHFLFVFENKLSWETNICHWNIIW